MGWNRKASDDDGSGSLELFSAGRSLVVQGSPTEVAAFIDQVKSLTKEAGGRGRHLVVDGIQVAANLAAYRQTHREFFEFSERAAALLREHGAIPNGDGFNWSFVKAGKNFAGNLDWKAINLSPEQALGLQAMAGQMALRAAIKDVVAAIERVEDKVDQIADLAKAERLGAVAADRGTLWPMVERVRSTGELSNTDWATIASLGPWIARDIESLRAHIVNQISKVGDSSFVRSRASDAEDLTEELVRESVALLVVAEMNYALWQELRIAHAATHERNALPSVTSDVRRQLEALTEADQGLVQRLSDVITQLTTPTGFEGLAVLQKRKLMEHAEDLVSLKTWFGDQRHLDYDSSELPELPGLADSLSNVGHVISSKTRSARKAIGEAKDRVRHPAELAPGDAQALALPSPQEAAVTNADETEDDPPASP